jgi:hypothetical protein
MPRKPQQSRTTGKPPPAAAKVLARQLPPEVSLGCILAALTLAACSLKFFFDRRQKGDTLLPSLVPFL